MAPSATSRRGNLAAGRGPAGAPGGVFVAWRLQVYLKWGAGIPSMHGWASSWIASGSSWEGDELVSVSCGAFAARSWPGAAGHPRQDYRVIPAH